MEALNSQSSNKSDMDSISEGPVRKKLNDNTEDTDKEQGAISYIKNLIHPQPSKKDKNDRSRFLGEGVSYKAKLIGILEVSEARGDRMCQEALADLKMAIRAAGEHKQRININIAIDGLRLRDEKTGDCLYHHPVHKISFIAQDMTDSRAFGYIFGSPDTGHRFFGIKTDKAASQVVISMRDLFQVVFELKKKEIEMAKQHIEQHQMKFSSPFSLNSHLGGSNSGTNGSSSTPKASIEPIKMLSSLSDDRRKEDATGDLSQKKVVDLLLDLELELSNIHQGISQMIKITPCDPMGSTTSMKMDQFEDSFSSIAQKAKLPPPPDSLKRVKNENQWFDQETEVLFEDAEVSSMSNAPDSSNATHTHTTSTVASTSATNNTITNEELIVKRSDSPKDSFDVFTDLDPLGTGRSRPYVDKKDFFQDLKNPPKKLLKDLVNEIPLEKSSVYNSNFSGSSETPNNQEIESDSTFLVKSVNSQNFHDPFQEDPFDKDPFIDEFAQNVTFQSYATDDPFEKFADFTSFENKESNLMVCPAINRTKLVDEKHSPLKVSLPPEKIISSESSMTSPLQSRKLNRLQKHNTIGGTVTLPSPKQKSRKVVSQISVDAFSENIAMPSSSQNALNLDQISSDISAPEPPPRSTLNSLSGKPPPLPPKKLISASSKPLPRPPNSDYDYIENYQTTAYSDFSGPPLPAPARKTKNNLKSTETEYYLQPFPLLPPPKKKTSPKSSESIDNVHSSTAPCPAKSLDITLSQLTKTGFSDLAASLNMSPSSLSKMTLQDLTKCLSSLSNDNLKKDKEALGNTESHINTDSKSNISFHENSDNEISFSAEFEAHFGGSSSGNVPCNEESLFDKYAVFRELVEQEQKQALSSQETNSNITLKHSSANDVNEVSTENKESPKENEIVIPSEDRYAALRDLCLDDNIQENEIDGSDKDSIVEASRLDEDTELFHSHLEEDTDLLPSHPHSESTESPTITMKEHQSVMETTIMEEDVSALDDDEVPEESTDTIPGENEPECSDKVPDIKSDLSKKYETSSILPEVDILEPKISTNQETGTNNAWAKFESNETVSEKSQETQNEGHVSPWSADSKDNDLSPTVEDKKKYCRSRRRVVRDEEESEEHWNMRMEPRSWSPSWRENGWSDGDSLCDEVPPYIRDYHCDWRSCRRRVSPWNSRDQSPWDEDERELSEDQWEDCRWQGETRQRQRYKGPSWEDERRRHYEELRKSRKPMAWSSDIDRKSSRESLTWEDDDRYSKRSYVERRHRKWDDEVQGRHRRWRDRERVEPGKKISVRYYCDRSHDHQWDDDYIEQGEADQTHWPQRPRSCDRSRRQYSGHHSNDDFNDRRYPRTMSRDEYSADIDYRRRAQTLQLQKSRRKHNITSSPFEDDFSSHFGYSNEINFAGSSSSDVFEGDIKQPSLSIDSRKKYQFSDCPKQKDYSQYGSPHTPGSVHSRDDDISLKSTNRCCQQSPFEDDFISPETRRCSGRSVSSDLSDPKSGDDVFYSEPKETYRSKCDNRRARISNKSDPGTSSSWQANKPVTPSSEYAQTDNSRKKITLGEREIESSEFSTQYNLEKKVNISDYKSILPGLKRSDSASSLKKSESINIFARNRDPFDDDFFCESSSKPSGIEKGKSNFVDSSKWNDAFNSFNFPDESK